MGRKGKWEYGNQVVRDALLPTLRLATLLLSNSGLWPWLDALLLSDWKVIPPHMMKDGCPPDNRAYLVHSFHPRPPSLQETDREKIAQILLNLTERFTIRFASIKQRPETLGKIAAAVHQGSYDKATGIPTKDVVNLMIETVVPLLRDDLTVAERLAQQLSVAVALVHETMHAVGTYALYLKRQAICAEPVSVSCPGEEVASLLRQFYEDEAISELGRSWETVTFGGIYIDTHNRIFRNFDEPALGGFIWSYPNFNFFGDGKFIPGKHQRFRHHNRFMSGAIEEDWPMQIDFIENIQQEAWWKTQTKHGAAVFKSPRVYGRKYIKGGQSTKILGPDYLAWAENRGGTEIPFPENADEVRKWEMEQQRRLRAFIIRTSARISKEYDIVLAAQAERLALDEERGQLEVLQMAANIYAPTNPGQSYRMYIARCDSVSLAVRALALVAISEMDHTLLSEYSETEESLKLRKETGLRLWKMYLDRNPNSAVAARVDAAIKKLIEDGQLRREATKEDFGLV